MSDTLFPAAVPDSEATKGVTRKLEKLDMNIMTVAALVVVLAGGCISIGIMYNKIDNLTLAIEASNESSHRLAEKMNEVEMQRAFERGERSAEKAFIAALAADVADLKRKATP